MTPYVYPGIMTIDHIVAMHFNVPLDALPKRTRKREVVEARQMAIYCRVGIDGQTWKDAAGMYGLDHSTVPYCLKIVDELRMNDRKYRQRYERIVSQYRQIKKISANDSAYNKKNV